MALVADGGAAPRRGGFVRGSTTVRSTGTGRHERHSAASGRIRGPRRSTDNGPLDGRRLIKFTPRDDRLACTSSLPAATAAAAAARYVYTGGRVMGHAGRLQRLRWTTRYVDATSAL